MNALGVKLTDLRVRLKSLGSVLVAYSGGADSSLLVKVAKDVLGNKVVAVTAVSETYPLSEAKSAKSLAQKHGVRHEFIKTRELKDPLFRNNPKNRCYICKKELFSKLTTLSRAFGLDAIVDGSNVDDLADHRPGSLAKKEFNVISPLQEAGFTKEDVRRLSKQLGLSTWSKPAQACLASRIPYNSKITRERLVNINKAEEILRKAFKIKGNLRVRDFQGTASIEVDKKDIKRVAASDRATVLLEALGYKKVVIDPRGYRRGSLNE
ncbi:MAG: TIGR00268 family protein [Candidatus Omnitrophica bacterium CG1_02_44_16]|nr:MAG: TIGR00268 family protein [Candidatus Omnitrophica bacterium CG1_02_44_16]PIY83772.1 MAG: TIGR00268 family protein [Candidatus Omnitrophica bacterium CG_4_10_14_0_8_um_filter_44_12]PIZ84480.1 MAG: TIGR00268 family protein [Candidatus Omnitrophica bacterium CG_4_10_14_0_2_um_filter_44_9]